MQGMLYEERDHLIRIDQEIHRLESVLAGLYEERKICIGRVNEYSVSLAPHKRLPSELLARIFLESQNGQAVVLPPNPNKLPWVLQRVCSRWRKVAQEEGQLWSDLDVEDPPLEKPSYKAEHVAVTWVPRLWSQTRSFPVSLTLGRSLDRDGGAVRDVLAPYFHRMRSISLYADPDMCPSIFVGHPYSFDALESLVLNIRERQSIATDPLPTKLLTASTRLREAIFRGRCTVSYEPDPIYLPSFCELPWSRLTHLAFDDIWLPSTDIEPILRQCDNLVSLIFTSTPNHTNHLDMNAPEVFLPYLQSITVLLGETRSNDYEEIFGLLRVPLLKELSFTTTSHKSDFIFNHNGIVSMIKRSGSNIKSLSLLGHMGYWSPERLLPELPNLVSLVVPDPQLGMSYSAFDMVVQGEVLQSLEHLECFTSSPVPFLELLEHQCMFPASSEHHGISFADVSYDYYSRHEEPDSVQELYGTLKPKFESCGKDITLKGIRVPIPVYGNSE